MRLKPALLVVLALPALAACHSRGGYFESDPVLALGPGCPDCPSRARWPAYFGTGGTAPQAEEIRTVAVVRPEPVRPQPAPVAAMYRPATAAVVVAPQRPMLVATARPAVVRTTTVEAPSLDVDFGLGGARPAPTATDPEPPVAPPRPGAPLPPPTPGSYRLADIPGYGR